MYLTMPIEVANAYKSPVQRVRVISEAWGTRNLYCACCSSDTLEPCSNNRQAIDYSCLKCSSGFQLKSAKAPFGTRIVDGSFSAMTTAIMSGHTPNLVLLNYDPVKWVVSSLILIPHFAFTISCLERRPPLRETARRAGWTGCNILLCNIPLDARIPMVTDGEVQAPADVRERFHSLQPLSKMNAFQRSWTLDVLTVVRMIGRAEFNLGEVYEYSDRLQELHPKNKHVLEKIRQQLQVLRDLRFIKFLGEGRYAVTAQPKPTS